MFCEKCGKKLADKDTFCQYCGARILRNTLPQETVYKDTDIKKESNDKACADKLAKKAKRAQKGKKIFTVVFIVILFATISVAGTLGYKYITRPYTKFDAALSEGASKANEIYEQIDNREEQKLAEEKALSYVHTLYEQYVNTAEADLAFVYSEMDELKSGILNSKKYSAELEDIRYALDEISDSRRQYDDGIRCYNTGDLVKALSCMQSVISKDVYDYENALNYIAQIEEKIVNDALMTCDSLLAEEKFEDAMDALNAALDCVPGNEELQTKMNNVWEEQEECLAKVSTEIVESAIETNNYSTVFLEVNKLLASFPDNEVIKASLVTLTDAFNAYYDTRIEELEEVKDYPAIEEVIEEMIDCNSGVDYLEEKLDYYKSFRPRLLLNEEAVGYKFTENYFLGSYGISIDEEREDTYGNVYPYDTAAGLICGYNAGDYDKKQGGSMTFANKGFIELTGTLAYDKNGEENGAVYFRVYADDVMVYDSGIITKDTEPISFTACLEDCEYFTIFWATASAGEVKAWNISGGSGTIILDNPIVSLY